MSHIWFTGGAALALSLGLSAQIVPKEIQSTEVEDGFSMYDSYCASCHGVDGKGAGPAAKFLKVPATNLTKLAAYNAGEFPSLQFLATLSQASGPHGSSDMPVWSNVFKVSGQSDSIVTLRLYNIMKYVQDMQDPPLVPKKRESKPMAPTVSSISPASGGDMYRAYCSSCHGGDGRGGPSAWTLKVTPTDLSTLARQHGGKFPSAAIRQVLLHGSGESVHGSSSMPVWGRVFADTGQSDAMQKLRVGNIIRYLEGLQR